MSITPRGFTLPEVLLALLLSGLLFTGALRVLPTFYQVAAGTADKLAAARDLAQLGNAVIQRLRRAGYCAGTCDGRALTINSQRHCVVIVWDKNHNGHWEAAEYSAIRLREGALEIRRGVRECDGKGWERLSAPNVLTIERWELRRIARKNYPPLILLTLVAKPVGRAWQNLKNLQWQGATSGFNLSAE